MYPVPFYDLQGWGLRSVACGQAIYAAAGDDQCITWGQGGGDSIAHFLGHLSTYQIFVSIF